MKVISNLIKLALIGLLSSTYLFNLSPIDYKDSIEIQTPVETSTLRLKTENKENLINPESVVITHTSEKEEVLKNATKNIFTASIYQNDKLITDNINNLELVALSSDSTLTINKDNPMITTLDISQKKLGLDDGNYKIVFQSNLISNSEYSTVSIDVTYDSGGTYIPAISAAPKGTKGFTLYFSTQNSDALIPVTRFLVENKSITRMTIEQLQNGPVDKGLTTAIGDVTNCTYNNGNVIIDIPSSYTQYNTGSSGSIMAYDTFVKSIFSVRKYWPIHSLRFTVDRKHVDTYFHGLDIKNPIPYAENNYVIYMTYKVNERYYLFDTKLDSNTSGINENDTAEIKAQKLFDAYKDNKLPYGRNPIPKGVALQSAKLEGSSLILDFNDSFLKAYENKDDLKLMMIESLIYSFTSIPNVDGIKIIVNNKPLTNFVKDRDLTGILTPPKFINPEAQQ